VALYTSAMPENRNLLERIRGNAEWEGIKWLWGAAGRSVMISAAYWLGQRFRHVHVDWIGLGILFFLIMILSYLLMPGRKPSSDSSAAAAAPVPSNERDKFAGGQAALLWHFAAKAGALVVLLDSTWHHWNNAGEALIHPLDVNHPKDFGSESAISLIRELRDFKILYEDHLACLHSEVPAFSSVTTSFGYPSKQEYSLVMSALRDHAESLKNAGQQVWDSGHPL
jgi:hypothetical protein